MRQRIRQQAVIDIHMEKRGAFDLVEGGISASGRYLVTPYPPREVIWCKRHDVGLASGEQCEQGAYWDEPCDTDDVWLVVPDVV